MSKDSSHIRTVLVDEDPGDDQWPMKSKCLWLEKNDPRKTSHMVLSHRERGDGSLEAQLLTYLTAGSTIVSISGGLSLIGMALPTVTATAITAWNSSITTLVFPTSIVVIGGILNVVPATTLALVAASGRVVVAVATEYCSIVSTSATASSAAFYLAAGTGASTIGCLTLATVDGRRQAFAGQVMLGLTALWLGLVGLPSTVGLGVVCSRIWAWIGPGLGTVMAFF